MLMDLKIVVLLKKNILGNLLRNGPDVLSAALLPWPEQLNSSTLLLAQFRHDLSNFVYRFGTGGRLG